MKAFWNERYSKEVFAYGEEPNKFLKSELKKNAVGTILFPAEGEGRNAVYAAQKGWSVSAFDLSEAGQQKASLLATKQGVEIDYIVNSFPDLPYTPNQFDVIVLIYAHFPANKKSEFHKILCNYLKPNGILIFEAFSKKHLEYVTLNPAVGGPKDIDMLFSLEEIKIDFSDFEILRLTEEVIELHEGVCHNGKGSVIRFVGRKKK